MPPLSGQFLVGQSPRRPYINRASKFFFAQLDKGFASPYVLVASGVFFSYLAWRVMEHYVRPRQEHLAQRLPVQRVPFEASHNVFWGLANPDEAGVSTTGSRGDDVEDIASNLFLPQLANERMEEAMRRPQLLFSEVSELHEQPSATNPSGEVDIVCLELSEFSPKLRDDVYYRSVHYVPAQGGSAVASSTGHQVSSLTGSKQTSSSRSGSSQKLMVRSDKVAEAPAAAAAASDSPLTTAEAGKAASTTDYLQFMPGQGEEVIHGIIKCKAVTTQNNCVPYAGHLEEEYARKLMLTLGPVHILRDATQTLLPRRFSFVKQVPVETLVLGMHSGELPRWLSTCYPNFNVHVVERDGTLVRLCRRFLGFQESSNLTVHIDDPVEYVRRQVAMRAHGNTTVAGVKPYELVLIDAIDGAGRLSTQYGRLEFISNIRRIMSDNGCIAVTLPNKDAEFVFNMVQNWRMGFTGRPVVLVHCVTSPCSILLTFQDTAARGKARIGSIAKVEEFQDVLREHIRHYGADRVQFDITREVSAGNFSVLNPEQAYGMEAYLPAGHPAILAARHQDVQEAVLRQRRSQGWGAWLRRLTGTALSPSQRSDLDGE
ncbi:conserved hypothetical protein [Leishmania braziliensis MHOM/BR/75/M2904]|uniref:Spermidine synthase n=2 Tax=Leishmania braziliensis TaxID=5660 RepID=A4H8K5_LEIBR|nr:conserved hypothetical protein [Leishmania braziliensis MHOM/BR/75/M2904]KAI5691832.1 hypothetical protein MNV84_02219 [Leishmania braziliensis]CAJ2469702.1 unnamed protein product [Leishmania braziliensis]CAJ2470210.1 unnamed protein product [Leishmania braziliensis]CAM37721.2 conserved hypothetical protein [Leishmania braziliensis MHOM/BR/75/M2904]SYZ64364.1 hypothetical_protein [Leishmania braziliensis MHOM/BR/75/M2904]